MQRMKHFIKQILLFISIPLALILLSDVWLRATNSLYKQKIAGLHNNKDSIAVLILGNSHATYGVDPSQFTLYTYNLANSGQTLYFDKRLTLSFINQLPQLRFVFISIDYHSLYSSSQGNRDKWLYYASGLKYKNRNYILEDISPFLFGYGPKLSVSLSRKAVGEKFKIGKDKTAQGTMIKGYIPFAGKPAMFNIKAYQKRAKTTTETVLKSVEAKEVLEDLDDFIEILKARNITPILFATPTYKEYNLLLDTSIINQNTATIDYLCRKHNVMYWDYSQDTSFTKEYFFDCDHLNITGAARFSKLLNNKMERIRNN